MGFKSNVTLSLLNSGLHDLSMKESPVRHRRVIKDCLGTHKQRRIKKDQLRRTKTKTPDITSIHYQGHKTQSSYKYLSNIHFDFGDIEPDRSILWDRSIESFRSPLRVEAEREEKGVTTLRI